MKKLKLRGFEGSAQGCPMCKKEWRLKLPSSHFTSRALPLWCPRSSSPKVESASKKRFPSRVVMSLSLFSVLLFTSIAQWLTGGVSSEKCNHHHQAFEKLGAQVSPQTTVTKQHCLFVERKRETLNPSPLSLFLLIIEHPCYSLHLLDA